MSTSIKIGLAGFGTVGRAFHQLLESRKGHGFEISRILVKDPSKLRQGVEALLTCRPEDLIEDPELDVIVEATGEMSLARYLAEAVLLKGKAFVTANKALVAWHGEGLRRLARRYGGCLLYEASCCGAIPVLRTLDKYYHTESITCLQGILNSTTNFLLDELLAGKGWDEALAHAWEQGLVESDPSLDLNGADAASKLAILIGHAWNVTCTPADFPWSGIDPGLFKWGLQQHIRLVAHAWLSAPGRLSACVLPTIVETGTPLSSIRGLHNGLIIENDQGERQWIAGAGAGGPATASAIWNDLLAWNQGYRYQTGRGAIRQTAVLDNEGELVALLFYDDWEKIPAISFDLIDAGFFSGGKYARLGRIKVADLLRQDWWKQPGVSLIAVGPAKSARTETLVRSVLEPELMKQLLSVV
ncbi:MAG: hypothetical protein KatS3mg029_0498 [Saprospiraceae bacterium]|nr:MAG: hypothetical protein KatS3mg029_0498 [Saprospiraceae bacterium]